MLQVRWNIGKPIMQKDRKRRAAVFDPIASRLQAHRDFDLHAKEIVGTPGKEQAQRAPKEKAQQEPLLPSLPAHFFPDVKFPFSNDVKVELNSDTTSGGGDLGSGTVSGTASEMGSDDFEIHVVRASRLARTPPHPRSTRRRSLATRKLPLAGGPLAVGRWLCWRLVRVARGADGVCATSSCVASQREIGGEDFELLSETDLHDMVTTDSLEGDLHAMAAEHVLATQHARAGEAAPASTGFAEHAPCVPDYAASLPDYAAHLPDVPEDVPLQHATGHHASAHHIKLNSAADAAPSSAAASAPPYLPNEAQPAYLGRRAYLQSALCLQVAIQTVCGLPPALHMPVEASEMQIFQMGNAFAMTPPPAAAAPLGELPPTMGVPLVNMGAHMGVPYQPPPASAP
jgi:hypothetical protein